MRLSRRLLQLFFTLASALAMSPSAAAGSLKVVSEGALTEANASRLVVHSDRLGRDFAVVVHMPAGTAFPLGQKLPAIYALDGGYGLAGPQGLFLSSRDVMAPAIIVSIGYLPGQSSMRETDLTYRPSPGISRGGGGAAFEAFLLQDLKPLIESKYPADPKASVLFGHSLGGLFAANVFAEKPDAFAGYIMGSVSVWADPGIVGRVAEAARSAHAERVFLSVGENEDGGDSSRTRMRQGFESMAAALKNNPGVTLDAKVYVGESHLSYYPKLIIDSFPFVLPKASVQASQPEC